MIRLTALVKEMKTGLNQAVSYKENVFFVNPNHISAVYDVQITTTTPPLKARLIMQGSGDILVLEDKGTVIDRMQTYYEKQERKVPVLP